MNEPLTGDAADRQRLVALTLRNSGPAAPPALRARIEAQIGCEQARRRPLTGRRVALAGGLAAAATAVVIALASLAGGGDLQVQEAAELSMRDVAEPAPSPQDGRPQLLDKSFEGVTYPNWAREFGWRAVGQRSDHAGGRHAETVFYEHEGHLIGYTVVSGSPLEPPDDATQVTREGVEVSLYRRADMRDVAVFERGGRTCVLSGHVMSRRTLVRLATWKGSGAVSFSS
jgi:hypothetical protein